MNTADNRSRVSELTPVAALYHENSKITQANLPYLAESVGEFSADLDKVRRSTTSAKTYPGLSRVELGNGNRAPRVSQALDKTLAQRRSGRGCSRSPITLGKIASLLKHACGVTGQITHPADASIIQKLRAYPSGGALYPVETYLAAINITDLAPCAYHYHAPDHCLETVTNDDVAQQILPLVLTMSEAKDISALLILTGRWSLPLSKYGERGYRVMLIDVGHVAQNLLLVATALEMNACPIAGFQDDALAGILGLNPAEEPVLYVIALG